MIKRELYMSRIRPFIGTELIKVMTGIRRCGKSVMLELIQQELTESGVSSAQFIAINFEDMSYSHLQTAQALHDEITKRAKEIGGKIYLFFDEIQEVKGWEKCINSLRVSLDAAIPVNFRTETAGGQDHLWPLRKVSHVGADSAGACGVRRQPGAVYFHQF